MLQFCLASRFKALPYYFIQINFKATPPQKLHPVATLPCPTNQEKLHIILNSHNFTIIAKEKNIQLDAARFKAAARNAIFYFLPRSYSLLHGVMLQYRHINFIIAGHHGAGKTTYAQFLKEKLGAKILANDYLILKQHQGAIWASDINFPQALRHRKPHKIQLIFFLQTEKEANNPDLYWPTPRETTRLAGQTLNLLPTNQQKEKRLSLFWQSIRHQQTFPLVINTRRKTIPITGQAMLRIIKHKNTVKKQTKISVAVVGLGNLGREIASRLSRKIYLKKLFLYNRNSEKQRGFILDLKQAMVTRGQNPEKLVGCKKFSDCLVADFIIIAIRHQAQSQLLKKLQEERMRHLYGNALVIQKFARDLARKQFSGTIILVSNPVGILLSLLYFYTNQAAKRLAESSPYRLWSFQCYGVGLELDKIRAKSWLREHGYNLRQPRAFIQHGDHLYLQCKLPKSEESRCKNWVRNIPTIVRRGGLRTVYAPAAITLKTIEAILFDKSVASSTIFYRFAAGGPITFYDGFPQLSWLKEKKIQQKLKDWQSFVLEINRKIIKAVDKKDLQNIH